MFISISSLGELYNGCRGLVPVVFVHNILKESIQEERGGGEQDNVEHINSLDSWRKFFVLPKMLKTTSQVRCDWDLTVVLDK
jgi:hypothetical protein